MYWCEQRGLNILLPATAGTGAYVMLLLAWRSAYEALVYRTNIALAAYFCFCYVHPALYCSYQVPGMYFHAEK